MANSWLGLTKEQRRERGKAHRFNRTGGLPPRRPISMCDVRRSERPRVKQAEWAFVRYGLMPEDEARLFERQGGKCALCYRVLGARYHTDHDHVTKIVRGLLCAGCNRVDVQGLERRGTEGVAYVTITPVDLFLRDAARINAGVSQ